MAWHLPSDAEWTTVETCLGGASVAGGAMKEAGTVHWTSPNTGATNSSGFTTLPGGFRNTDGTFAGVSTNGYWWSSTEDNTVYAWDRQLVYTDGNFYRFSNLKLHGFSFRCLRD